MKKINLLNLIAAAAAVVCMAPAGAANIVLHDTSNSFAIAPNGADALLAFQKAANYWNKTLTNDATININISFAALDAGVLGQAGSAGQAVNVADVYASLAATGNSALDSIAVKNLSKLNEYGSLAMRVNGYLDPAKSFGVDVGGASRLSNGNNGINQALWVNQSVVKALGLQLDPRAERYDANITFSSSFGFDFNPTNGIGAGLYDFTAVAVHELGHALGFVSGTDSFDALGRSKKGPGPAADAFEAGAFGTTNIDDFAIGSTLDLFRYGNGLNADGSRQLQWGADRTAFFSIDGNKVFNLPDNDQEAAFFSTGQFNGDGSQASHWKDNLGALDGDGMCFQSSRAIGIMDPTASPCHTGNVTQNDLAAFDAMGWNLDGDVLQKKNYSMDTAQIYAMDGVATVVAVPEPATWAQLLLGFGIIGGFLSRRRGARA
ncbi:NF038122 family metalloprotease [Roseateles oligotrophus]|uniref:NF038122 family metalloprotease n=1 Tax=Roseateles oligotrophus TaxID=1769250 RepID=A0ABT2YC19_9BURK|nr:NF038122 family metalloprotease [Roseateles oligotrophus]MCV2367580.1 NF038122 family metalloprotease [Roseateles oligotrophus]